MALGGMSLLGVVLSGIGLVGLGGTATGVPMAAFIAAFSLATLVTFILISTSDEGIKNSPLR